MNDKMIKSVTFFFYKISDSPVDCEIQKVKRYQRMDKVPQKVMILGVLTKN